MSTLNDKSQYLKIDLKGRWNIIGFAIAASDYYNHGTREVRIFYRYEIEHLIQVSIKLSEMVDSHKHLGVIIDKHLLWDKQIYVMCL